MTMKPAEAQPVSINADGNNPGVQQLGEPSRIGGDRCPTRKKIRRHQTAAHLCRYGNKDSEVAVGRSVSVGQIVSVIATELAFC